MARFYFFCKEVLPRQIVPKAIDPFDAYIIMVWGYLTANTNANALRLLVATLNMTTLGNLINTPLTGWTALHTLHASKVGKNSEINHNLTICEVAITKLLQAIYHDIPRSLLSTKDYLTFNIAIPTTTKGVRPAITNIPFGKVYSNGGAIVGFIVRTDSHAKRAAMDPLADAIWVDGMILKPGDPLPTDPSQCNLTFTSKEALFTHPFTAADAGNRFVCFLHYVNLTDDKKSGGTSGLISCIIGL